MKKAFAFLFIISHVVVVTGQNKSQFDSYISNFKSIQTGIPTRSDFSLGSSKAITQDFVEQFVTSTPDRECLNEGLWYRYMFTIEKGDFIIAFVAKSCDIPSPSGSYPYTDYILIVYSPKGEITDSKIVSREGDLWECNHHGTVEPFVLMVEQANVPEKVFEKSKRYPLPCEISTCEYRVSKKGRIQQTVISEGKGTIVWDKKNNRSSIVKNIDEKEAL